MRLAACLAGLLLVGCGGGGVGTSSRPSPPARAKLPPDYVPLSVGPGPLYRPGLRSPRVRSALPVDGLRCDRRPSRRFGAHLEVFAHQHVVAIPGGIGLASPLVRTGASVRSARCSYPAITGDPTGVIEVRAGSRITLGELFDLWGQPLGRRAVASFRAPVTAFLDGHRWASDPRRIPLSRHGRITLEVASQVLPHRVYLFPPGL